MGRDFHADDGELEELRDPLFRALLEEPHPATTERHLTLMSAAARTLEREAERRPARGWVRGPLAGWRNAPPRRRLVIAAAKLAALPVALTGVSAALATAGVDLPALVRAPYEAVGIALPNQGQPEAAPAREANRPDARPAGSSRSADEQTRRSGKEATKGRRGSAERAERSSQRTGEPGARPPAGGSSPPRRVPQGGGHSRAGTAGQRSSTAREHSQPGPRESERRSGAAGGQSQAPPPANGAGSEPLDPAERPVAPQAAPRSAPKR